MKTIQDHKKDIDVLGNLLTMVTVSQELSAMEIKRLKEKIAHEQTFHQELSQVHQIVYVKSRQEQAPSATSPTQIAVYVSTQTHFTGSLLYETFELFMEFLKQHPDSSIVICAAQKHQLFEDKRLSQARFMQLPPDLYSLQIEPEMVDFFASADQIHFFRGGFVTLGIQRPAHQKLIDDTLTDEALITRYLHEPDAQTLTDFFTRELFNDRLVHVIKQSNLANQGARFLQLDQAGQKIKKTLSQTGYLLHRSLTLKQNEDQITRVARLMALKGR